ncbi:acyl-CoA/acyl-ACP dehydrogenase [Streptomyces sp. HU2014]|uniref:acyl-CoA dehydrogenase family protein n=1 Tax=Streptomyces sp. HU2014 TaxID=2939414 RepID=UPI002010B3DD|nr:acyl-CoA dehydrogenase family protein [Streptomyces sp. HU2014]UQI46670.1 acyl-CoA/acyl-ACP dehydrogenase [Streptomyces sp. HU2014]
MRFLLDDEQVAFGRALDRMLTAAGTPGAVRAWARGEHGPGLALWRRLAEAGVFGLAVPEAYGGVGPLPVELAVAYERLGRHAVPGPVVETAAVAALLSRLADAGEPGPAAEWLPRVCAGEARLTLTLPGGGPYALDADVCDGVFVVREGAADEEAEGAGADSGGTGRTPASRPLRRGRLLPAPPPRPPRLFLAGGHGPVQGSVDPARRLARPVPGRELPLPGAAVRAAAAHAADLAAFACAAQALGVGRALLERTVAYVGARTQFGSPVGAFQAVKHRLADTRTGLEFARPLVHGAAVALAAGAPGAAAEVAAAKATACDVAYAAARTALQLHGAIGYTAEYDLSLWIGKARALRSAWGSPADFRALALDLFCE